MQVNHSDSTLIRTILSQGRSREVSPGLGARLPTWLLFLFLCALRPSQGLWRPPDDATLSMHPSCLGHPLPRRLEQLYETVQDALHIPDRWQMTNFRLRLLGPSRASQCRIGCDHKQYRLGLVRPTPFPLSFPTYSHKASLLLPLIGLCVSILPVFSTSVNAMIELC